jgi:putative sigma-54 modulation protein
MNKKIDIFTKEMELNKEIQDYIDNKISRLYRYLDQIEETRIDLTHARTAKEEASRFVAQITLRGRGFILRAEERADNIKAALNLVMDKIERQIERYKGKKYHNHTGAIPVSELLIEEVPEEPLPLVVRRKKFMLVPMDELEAIEQMNLLGHEDFFIFYNIGASAINVLYKRRDGSYGIIEPELG